MEFWSLFSNKVWEVFVSKDFITKNLNFRLTTVTHANYNLLKTLNRPLNSRQHVFAQLALARAI